MLSTKTLVNDYKEVPPNWIFEYYCKLQEKLVGQDVKIPSIFNPNDRTPSMCIYFDAEKKIYKFKDFSTGKSGTAVDIVKELKGLNFHLAAITIAEDYNEFLLHNKQYTVEAFKVCNKYRVTDHQTRKWNTADQYQWTQFHIGSRMLTEYCVRALSSYTMSKEEDGEMKNLKIEGDYIYGFFTRDGELYKIYQPKVKDKKYIKIKNYIQGSEQLHGYDVLAITSGLKDIMSLKALPLKVDYIAPDSENTMLPKDMMIELLKTYKKIFVFFDNDEAGIKAMKKYREEYNLPCILLTLAKDPADSMKTYGPKRVLHKLVPLFDAQLCSI